MRPDEINQLLDELVRLRKAIKLLYPVEDGTEDQAALVELGVLTPRTDAEKMYACRDCDEPTDAPCPNDCYDFSWRSK